MSNRLPAMAALTLLTLVPLPACSGDPQPPPTQPATAPADLNADSPADLATLRILEANVKEIMADQQSLEKVLAFLNDSMNVNMDVRWNMLADAGIDRNTPISVNLKEVPFSRVLTTV